MARYIDVRPGDGELPGELRLTVGDVVRVAASGARVTAGDGVEVLGVLTEAVVGTDGSVLTPLGPPTTVLLRARAAGRADVDVVRGDPYRSPSARRITFSVEK
jgi:hypothetical protein